MGWSTEKQTKVKTELCSEWVDRVATIALLNFFMILLFNPMQFDVNKQFEGLNKYYHCFRFAVLIAHAMICVMVGSPWPAHGELSEFTWIVFSVCCASNLFFFSSFAFSSRTAAASRTSSLSEP